MSRPIEIVHDVDVKLTNQIGGDAAVVASARVSTIGAASLDELGVDPAEAEGLIRYLMRSRHGCFDDETDVLTDRGWVPWPKVDGTERFLTRNLKTDQIEWQAAERLVRKPAELMLSIKTAHVDALVTPMHNMVAAKRVNGGHEELGLHPAMDLFEREYRIPLTGGEWGPDAESHRFAWLVGFIAADGSVPESGGSVSFNLRKQSKIEALLEHGGYATKTDGHYAVSVADGLGELAEQTYTKDRERCFPPSWVKYGNAATLRAMLDGFLAGDGSTSEHGAVSASTVSRQMVDDLQAVCVKIGLVAVEREADTERSGSFGGRPLFRLGIFEGRKTNPRIGQTLASRRQQLQLVGYTGMVHCVTVPNGTLYVRRNGKPMWCGNTPFEHNLFTFFVDAPIKVWREHHRHRIGFCLAGDMMISVGTHKNGQKKSIADIYEHWHEGVLDSMGRRRKLTSCRNLVARTMDESTGHIHQARMIDVFQSGVKPILRVTTEYGHTLRCSADHPLWAGDGWVKAGDLRTGDTVYRAGKGAIEETLGVPRRLREGIQFWTREQKRHLVKPLDRCHICGDLFDYDELEMDHVVPVSQDLARALDVSNLEPACRSCHREKSVAEGLALVDRRPKQGMKAVPDRVVSVIPDGEEMTYDIEMPAPHHSFVANDLIVHNSFNETSGRYKEMEPRFYTAPPTRRLVQEGKPGAYVFVPATSEQHRSYENRLYNVFFDAWSQYQRLLAEGIALEAARDVLPVNLMSQCWVTCNARSLMSFLSLRTERESPVRWEQVEPGRIEPYLDELVTQRDAWAWNKSTPMQEIAMVAEKYEAVFAEAMPITYKAFCDYGRVAP